MGNQKQAVLELVETHRGQGRSVGEVLGSVGIARASYYRWKKGEGEQKVERQSTYELTGEERELIDEVKAKHPQYRHRRIQGMLQQQGVYLSATAIYGRRLGGSTACDISLLARGNSSSAPWSWESSSTRIL